MKQKTNYNIEMKKLIETLDGNIPSILLHSCCGPCSTHVITTLSKYFNITVYYYNPNIEPIEEYNFRKEEQKRFIDEIEKYNKLDYLDCDYDNEVFQENIKGLEEEAEGGARCKKCYYLRLSATAKVAKELKYEFFATTLSVSPTKNSQVLNELGLIIENQTKIKFLVSDFKKEDGYKKSVELAKRYELYRQDYCGCSYSKGKK